MAIDARAGWREPWLEVIDVRSPWLEPREPGRPRVAEALARGLRAAVLDLGEVLGVEVTASRRARVGAMGVGELEALRRALKQTRRWPRAERAVAPRAAKAARAR